MQIDKTFIKALRKFVDEGYVTERPGHGGELSIFNYTDVCAYDRVWNPYTRAARGLIWDNVHDQLLARPFPKFFNLGENEETQPHALPKTDFTVTVKEDGSLGILYFHNGQWHVSTRGSMESDQARWATEWLRSNTDLEGLTASRRYLDDLTLLFEIIYPENRIVVDYKGWSGLVLLSAVSIPDGREVNYDWLSSISFGLGFRMVDKVPSFQLDKLIESVEQMNHNQEGYVISYQGGLKVKLKSPAYLKVFKVVSNLSPLSLWESMDQNGKIPRDVLAQLPEEFRGEFERIASSLEEAYEKLQSQAVEILRSGIGALSRKEIAQKILKENPELAPIVFHMLDGKSYHKYIMQKIRPTGNLLKGSGE